MHRDRTGSFCGMRLEFERVQCNIPFIELFLDPSEDPNDDLAMIMPPPSCFPNILVSDATMYG